ERPDAQLETAAALLEEFGRTGAAQSVYKKLIEQKKTPESKLLFAAFLARQGLEQGTQKALDLCDEVWPSYDVEKVAYIAVAVLGAIETPSEQQIQRVERPLADALRKSPKSLALLFYMAGLRSLEKKYDEAEKLYRQIIEQDPKSALARNNLAWLLAARDGRPKADEALKLVNQAMQLVGPSAEYLDTRAFIY